MKIENLPIPINFNIYRVFRYKFNPGVVTLFQIPPGFYVKVSKISKMSNNISFGISKPMTKKMITIEIDKKDM